jgi:hypothetical protein
LGILNFLSGISEKHLRAFFAIQILLDMFELLKQLLAHHLLSFLIEGFIPLDTVQSEDAVGDVILLHVHEGECGGNSAQQHYQRVSDDPELAEARGERIRIRIADGEHFFDYVATGKANEEVLADAEGGLNAGTLDAIDVDLTVLLDVPLPEVFDDITYRVLNEERDENGAHGEVLTCQRLQLVWVVGGWRRRRQETPYDGRADDLHFVD